jgi:hypothetical protein
MLQDASMYGQNNDALFAMIKLMNVVKISTYNLNDIQKIRCSACVR